MRKRDLQQLSLELHNKHKGKICVTCKVPLKTKLDLSLAYTPGVAEPCREIVKNKDKLYNYTSKSNLVAVITNGTAVLGLGDIGADASLPVMEGKAVLFKTFGGVDSFPIAIDSKDPDEIVNIVKKISSIFGGINLEDIKAPECFEIERRLIEKLDIPVMHDDQHGTAVVVLAGLINSFKITNKNKKARIVISGAGAAGIATTKLLLKYGFENILLCDTKGTVYQGRDNLNPAKEEIAKVTNKTNIKGQLKDALKGADVFIGLSAPGIVTKEMVKSMSKDPIIFAMSNPIPEIMPDEALKGGAKIIATGRSDFPNQINNVLAFPGIFKGALKIRAKITDKMKLAAAEALAGLIKKPTPEKIIPSPFDKNIAETVAKAVIKAA